MFMALHRQGNGSLGTAFSLQGHGAGDQKFSNGGRLGTSSRGIEIPSRGAMKPARAKRFGRTSRGSQYGIGLFLFLLLCVVSFTILGGDYLFSAGRLGKVDRRKEDHVSSIWNGFDDHNDKALNFGKDSVGMEDFLAKDSRDWDKDDRIRHNYMDYNEDLHSFDRNVANTDIGADAEFDSERQLAANAQDLALKHRKDGSKIHVSEESDDADASERQVEKESGQRETPKEVIGGWYNEGGRKELRMYEEQYEALLKQELDSSSKEHDLGFASGQGNKGGEDKPRSGAKGGLGNDFTDKVKDDQANMLKTGKNNNAIDEGDDDDDYDDHGDEDEFLDEFDVEYDHVSKRTQDENIPEVLNVTSEQSVRYSNQQKDFEDILSQTISSSQQDSRSTEKSLNEKSMQEDISKGRLQKVEKRRTVRRRSSRRTRRRRRAGSSCDVTFRNSTRGLREPENSKFSRFSLSYVDTEERPHGSNIWEPRFAGHQTLSEREESFKARDQTIHCGFVQGSNGPSSTGFDLAEDDVRFLSKCHIAVSSCIFANSDHIRSPRGKKFTGTFKKEVCFVMFVDQRTLDVMIEEGEAPDQRGFYGSWKVVVVRNLPYSDARRTGKVPKFLTHRLFPSARYSIWLDSKLRLQSDPVLLLEYFLWRGGYEYAISNHYDRHCVWEEVQQNKRLNKFNHSIIDEQFAFYRADGLTKFNASDPKKLLPSHVPEGSFIVRAHTPMSNLFSCLWFNEVDRFTPRDQLSFAYTYLKLVRMNPDKSFYLNMFKDCERKGIAKLFRHRRNVTRLLQR